MSPSGAPIGEDDLQAFADGRLSRERAALVEDHARGNPQTAHRLASYRAHREQLSARLRFRADAPIPARLRIAAILAERARHRAQWARRAAAACLLLGIGAGIGWTARSWTAGEQQSAAPGADAVAELAAAAHRLFAVEVTHPVEVDASRKDHLGRWISERLGHALPVPDLTAQGFRLVGGRVLPGGEDAAAQIMYENVDRERLTIYVKAGEQGASPPRFTTLGELSAFVWRDDGCFYAVASKLGRDELDPAADAAFQQIEAASDADAG